jgi:sortase (surface protein transpeptidase)
MQVVAGVIDPPTADKAYWVSNRGSMPASNTAGTVFIAGHSWSRGSAAFNVLFDPARGDGTVPVGALVTLQTTTGRLSYRVGSVQRVAKTLVDRGEVPVMMQAVPGRLVLMTCTWYTGEPPSWAQDNVLVTAQLVEPS